MPTCVGPMLSIYFHSIESDGCRTMGEKVGAAEKRSCVRPSIRVNVIVARC